MMRERANRTFQRGRVMRNALLGVGDKEYRAKQRARVYRVKIGKRREGVEYLYRERAKSRVFGKGELESNCELGVLVGHQNLFRCSIYLLSIMEFIFSNREYKYTCVLRICGAAEKAISLILIGSAMCDSDDFNCSLVI